jgi:RNAse (barnase) inhibitor barstar
MEGLMPRFYFHLKSKQSRIPDDKGKNLDTLNDAYEHGRKLVDKILQHWLR